MKVMKAGILPTSLVVAQFVLMPVLILFGYRQVFASLFLQIMAGASILLMANSILAMKLKYLRITPSPGENHELCTRGAYRWIRHPMYSAGLLLCGSFTIGANTMGSTGLWILLFMTLYMKARVEEKLWLASSRSYAPYMSNTKMFVPLLF